MARSSPLQALIETLERSDPGVSLTRGHLLARVRPPGALEQGETYEVDLASARLVHTLGGKPITFARAQLVGTFVPSEASWMWGFANDSVAEEGFKDIRDAVRAEPRLAALAAEKVLPADERQSEALAQWIAVKAGYFAAYPAQVDDRETIAYLALRLRLAEDDPQKDERDLWCSGCGLARSQVEVLVRGVAGSICETCASLAREIREDQDADEDLERPTQEFMPACIMTGRCIPRLYLPYVAVSWAALIKIWEVLDAKGLA
jgi:ClpX C4-type zinc finger